MSNRRAAVLSILAAVMVLGLSGCGGFPALCDVPDRPLTTTAEEREEFRQELESDREAQNRAREAISGDAATRSP